MDSPGSSNNLHFSTVVVGSYVHDHVWLTDRFPETGETRRALGFSTGPGGKGFNQAVACRRQGGEVVFIGALGDDALAQAARAFAEQEGLDCRWQICTGTPTAAASIVVDADGANRILVNLAANELLEVDFLQAHVASFSGARVLLAQLENSLDTVRAALALGRRHGLVTLLNPAPVHADIDAGLLALCDLITPNELEFALLLERISGEKVDHSGLATQADEQLHALCRRLDVGSVVITLGAAGCFVSHGAGARFEAGSHYRIPAERVRAIDTVGAGDAFNGALAAALADPEAGTFRDAVVHANRVAALSTEKIGASLAMPTLSEVHDRFGAD
ncbi:ribokinase [Dokdonella immobilis]|uniref:Ribokinase n=1 Tax=Dokdonella immobilis TaxID=578942 RepID=A0A1I4VI84_9GAMM|nr:ribokinase [Dokdonella immobilis]SFN00964.1 ribokinase [Dokdonella immobilis]